MRQLVEIMLITCIGLLVLLGILAGAFLFSLLAIGVIMIIVHEPTYGALTAAVLLLAYAVGKSFMDTEDKEEQEQ